MAESGNSISRSYPAIPAAVAAVRHAITGLAEEAHASAEVVEAINLAVSEAVTNVVVHAYRGRNGSIQVVAALTDDALQVLIADDGCGMHARLDSPGLGLGLMLIAQQCDEFMIVPRAGRGTELRMLFALAPAALRRSQLRGSVATASTPAAARFSTTT